MDDESRTRAQRLAALVTDLDRLIRADVKRGSGAPLDLTLTQVQALAYVAQADRPSQVAIARHLRVTGPTLVRVLDALERKGLVTRTRAQPDRRIAHIALTEEGACVLGAYAAWREQRLGTILARLPTRTVTALIRNLAALLAAPEGRSERS